MLQQIILAIVPLIALIVSGYLLKKYRFLDEGFWHGAERLNYYILFPALLFDSTAHAKIEFMQMKQPIVLMFSVILCTTLVLYGLRFIRPIPSARFGVHVQSMVRFNTYIGLALVGTLYSQQGITILAVLLALCIPVVNVISVLSLTSQNEMKFKSILLSLLKNPLILSCLFGGIVNILHIPIWEGITRFIHLFSLSSLPLGLLCVGAALQFISLKKELPILFTDVIGRLIIVPSLVYILGIWLSVPKLELQVLIIFFALPTASASYILTKVLKGDSQLMAAVISLQTLCAAVTLPMLIWWTA